MKDLKKESGLNVSLKDNFKLELDIKLLGGEFSYRTIRDMTSVIKDKIEINDDPLYFMYRDLRERADDQKIKGNHLRFDLTVILPRMIGSEFDKTLGHYHPVKVGTDVSYPEVYEVLSGTALYLLQKPGKKNKALDEVYLVEVNAGETAIMPPGFGHISINPLSSPLVMSNWACSDFESEYDLYKENHGGGYYIVEDKEQKKSWMAVKNDNYAKIPKMIKAKPKELAHFGIRFNQPIYRVGTKSMSRLEYLSKPEEYLDLLSPEKLFNITE